MSVLTRGRRARWRAGIGLIGVLVGALLVIELLVWLQTRPQEPAGAVPVAATQQLAARHGCWVPELWGGGAARGALIGSTDPARPPRVAWVPVGDVRRWQPDWQPREWCSH
jgi:hypothetical protein